ncbi:MAG: 23S rRNA (uracil(1939)-C(5))-methyltransferase RlmD [Flavobacteriales bacterium]|jgi:23S rRNA (uracil1939-C5)-methyltransferase|nr:23S rRNA (uracil(1939)-C(5))-methyltransferase RlmD [Flavobacteriaceae bacterium]MDO7582276.1 23S rRNA (uracil(1939)-C(5))-methyltransferase RlmD [Flavobacteriaceae bacterium]MDO7592079.1 23S rRNA (uracil(1939)-C(5))-methyltransferase RlmD [Flavobacteriaceae bacterium]MDO7598577.1 23S rRNA (uracil(1939)-C(5))-methyltransferase RlmD [Flavobacteriaceae bacterium]MDO7603269.1 23S rRNA (uracil(1939)-C(5))-methyltransferase RlmD [Flavobacteriaceae bacterium]|tara:strand:- start:3166 stop:4572 length:1407 start_codon:yes stop_codon:yes gene_type:complete
MGRRSKNQLFEGVKVVDTASKGKTVAKTDEGAIIFLNSGVPGDVVDISTYKKRKGFYEGNIVKFHTLSEHRTEPVCEHFGVCGGCKWQHMKYDAQLIFKQKEVAENLKRIGKLDLPELKPILAVENPYWYRNKMEFSFSNQRWLTKEEVDSGIEINRNALGFHKPGMWDKIVDVDKCHLQADPSNAIRNFVRLYAHKNELTFFDPKNQVGFLRSLMIRTTSTDEVMIVLQIFHKEDAILFPLLDAVATEFPYLTSIQYVINGKANDTIYDQEIVCYKGQDFITEVMEDLQFKITAKSFYQTNSLQAYELYKVVRELADLKGDELVYDLYTGTGTIAQFVAQNALKVVGVDVVPDSIEAAKTNAIHNKIDNVFFETGDMKDIFTEDFITRHGKASVVITDPPRDGMHKDVVQQLLYLSPERIVYVSCNSATQARDLSLMKEKYRVIASQAVDMFPQTHHVENVVLLEKI